MVYNKCAGGNVFLLFPFTLIYSNIILPFEWPLPTVSSPLMEFFLIPSDTVDEYYDKIVNYVFLS